MRPQIRAHPRVPTVAAIGQRVEHAGVDQQWHRLAPLRRSREREPLSRRFFRCAGMRRNPLEEQVFVAFGDIGKATIERPRERGQLYGGGPPSEVGRERFTNDGRRRLAFPASVELQIALEGFRNKDGRALHVCMLAYIIYTMILHLIDGTYELFRHFYGFRRTNLPPPPLGAVAGVLGTIMQMLDEGATHVGGRHRSRHRIVPQRSLARLQDRRGHRSGVVGAVPSPRRVPRRHGGDDMADGRARGRRRARVGRACRVARSACREGVHLDAGQGSRAVRRRQSRRAGGSAERRDSRRGARAGEVRCWARVHPRLPGARRRFVRRLPWRSGHRPEDRGASDRPARPSRAISRRACSETTASARCSSRTSRRSAPMRRCSTTSSAFDGQVQRMDSSLSPRKLETPGSRRERCARLILVRYEVETLPRPCRRARLGHARPEAGGDQLRSCRAARALRSRMGVGAHAGSAVGVVSRRPALERSLAGHQPGCARGAPGPSRVRAEGSRRHSARSTLDCRPPQLRPVPPSVSNDGGRLSASAAPDSHVDARAACRAPSSSSIRCASRP